MTAINAYNRITSIIGTTMDRISTGRKNVNAKDNPSYYSIAKRMQSQIGSLEQSNRNVQTGNAMLKTAESGNTSALALLSTIREKILSANGTNNDEDNSTLQNEINNLVDEIDNNSSVTYNGKNILRGERVTFAGINGYENIKLNDISSEGLGLRDNNGNINIDVNDMNSALVLVDNAIGITNDNSMQLDDKYSVLDNISFLGIEQQKLDYKSNNYITEIENTTAALSTLDDVNIAEEMVKLHSLNLQEQLALFAQKQDITNLRMNALKNFF